MKVEVTMKMVLDLGKNDTKALKNASPIEVVQTAQMQNAPISIDVKKEK